MSELNGMPALRDYLATRRTTAAGFLDSPSPDRATLDQMLTMAARDPDATKALAERLALRKTLVTDELLALSALDADARRRQTQV